MFKNELMFETWPIAGGPARGSNAPLHSETQVISITAKPGSGNTSFCLAEGRKQ